MHYIGAFALWEKKREKNRKKWEGAEFFRGVQLFLVIETQVDRA